MTTFTLQDLTPEQQDTEALVAMAKLGGGVEIQVEQNAPEPQPTLCEVTQTPDLESIINTICTQLQLLSTVIKGERAQGATPPEGNQSLQDTVALTLQQADWFRDMVAQHLKDMGIEDIAESVVENLVEREVEHYFDVRFDPSDHFDMDDAIASRVDDRLDDIVRERLDEVVHEQLEEVVTEKLSEANVSISF